MSATNDAVPSSTQAPTDQNQLLDEVMSHCIRDDVRRLHAYAVQDARGMVKLDVMENPYTLAPPLAKQLADRLALVALNRYPAERTETLRVRLKAHAALLPSEDLVMGNGSDELISLLAMACAQPGATVLAPVPGFVMYAMSAQLQGLRFVGVDLNPDFSLNVPAMVAAIHAEAPRLVYLAYPNNPTANLWDEADISACIEAAKTVRAIVVMDEAYQPFAGKNSVHWMRRHANVVIMRTLSKFGLAGVRIGYLVGAKALVQHLEKVRPPFNVSVLNTEAALFALENAQVYANQAEAICAERTRVSLALAELPGCQVFPSQANMVLVRVPDATAAFEGLKAHGILVKNVSGAHPLLHQCLRVTIGMPSENQLFLNAMKDLLS